MSVVVAHLRQAAVARSPYRNLTRSLISDVAIHVGIDNVLSGSIELRKSGAELLPVLRRVEFEKRIAHAIVKRPAQRKLPRFPGHQVRNDGTMPRERDVESPVRLAFDANDFVAPLRLLPPIWSLILSRRIDRLDINIFNCRTNIG